MRRGIEQGLTDSDKMRLGRDPTIHWPFEVDPTEGTCPQCAGRGVVLEEIDDEKFPVPVPCDRCTTYCLACARRVPRHGHSCPQPKEQTE
jgi:hypothetical protein